MQSDTCPVRPPLDHATARLKVRATGDAWNTRDPQRVSFAYRPDSLRRDRSEFIRGRAVVASLILKWTRELDYRLIKELWAFGENRIAVRFAYECHDSFHQWFRSYGNKNWESAQSGHMRCSDASINDLPIAVTDRLEV